MYKKIISILCSFAIVIFLIVPVFAEASGETKATYWDHFIHRIQDNVPTQDADPIWILVRLLNSAQSVQVCKSQNSPDGWHHTSDNPQTRDHNGQLQARCRYCSDWFNVDAADLEAAYQDYVQNEMPAQQVDSSNKLTWYVSFGSVNSFNIGVTVCHANATYKQGAWYANALGSSSVTPANLTNYAYGDRIYAAVSEVTNSNRAYRLIIHRENNEKLETSLFETSLSFYFDISVPIDGVYKSVAGSGTSGTYVQDGTPYEFTSNIYSSTNVGYFSCGNSMKVSGSNYLSPPSGTVSIMPTVSNKTNQATAFFGLYYLPVFEITPTSEFFDNNPTYNIDTRAAIVSGDLAVMGDNNTLTKVNTTIINETNNTYYNPTTDTTSTITDWSYNYTDRSYTLTLENGDEAQVVYGNDNVTITEGGNTYTYYYYVDETTNNNNGSGSGGSGGGNFFGNATGTDLWGAVGDTLGSLLLAPLRIIETVLVKVIGWLGSLAETIGDGIANLVETILGWFDSLPELFSGFLGFLTAIFPFIPEEAMVFITVGLAAVVIIGIIRALRRR